MKNLILLVIFSTIFTQLKAQGDIFLWIKNAPINKQILNLNMFYMDSSSTTINSTRNLSKFPWLIGFTGGFALYPNEIVYINPLNGGFSFNRHMVNWYDHIGGGLKIKMGGKKEFYLKTELNMGYHYNLIDFGTFSPYTFNYNIQIGDLNVTDTLLVRMKTHSLTINPNLKLGYKLSESLFIEFEAAYNYQFYDDSYMVLKNKIDLDGEFLIGLIKKRTGLEHIYDSYGQPLQTTPFNLNGFSFGLKLNIVIED